MHSTGTRFYEQQKRWSWLFLRIQLQLQEDWNLQHMQQGSIKGRLCQQVLPRALELAVMLVLMIAAAAGKAAMTTRNRHRGNMSCSCYTC
jgi:hypothetical protein